jgi:catechol 2,3-dioxygenase-like lactoylglutathione lyase family enzyme
MQPAVARVPKFHFGLNVSDLGRSVAFYRLLFGLEPAKHYPDYAKFELADPPLAMSLLPNPQTRGGTLNHLGFRLADSAALVAVQRRLEEGGVSTHREDGVECCYAKQTKFWATDPDRNLWEMYVLEDDLHHKGAGQVPEAVPHVVASEQAESVTWEHRFGTPIPERVPHESGTVDVVRWEGTWGQTGDLDQIRRLAVESFRALRPGGSIRAHGLVADKLFPAGSVLPGPAAVVKHVPTESESFAALSAAGFANLACEKLANTPCFLVNGVALRELRLNGWKPERPLLRQTHLVVYKGPFATVEDDFGNVYKCGERVTIDARTFALLQQGPLAGQFVLTTAGAEAGCCPA